MCKVHGNNCAKKVYGNVQLCKVYGNVQLCKVHGHTSATILYMKKLWNGRFDNIQEKGL